MNTIITKMAGKQPGLLGMDRYCSPEGVGFSISYWKDLECIKAWRNVEKHAFAQNEARKKWFSQYTIRTCKVEQDYHWGK